jgi:hypothetical protein
MADATLDFVLERLKLLQTEQSDIRREIESWRIELRDGIAGFRDEMRVQTTMLIRITNDIDRQARHLDHIVERFDVRLKKLEAQS